MLHDTITVIGDTPPNSELVIQIQDDVIRTGFGFIETETEKYEVCMNDRNSNKLAVLIANDSIIQVNIDGIHGMMSDASKPLRSEDTDNTVFFTIFN